MPENAPKAPAVAVVPNPVNLALFTATVTLLAAEVQRTGMGMKMNKVRDAKDLAQKALDLCVEGK